LAVTATVDAESTGKVEITVGAVASIPATAHPIMPITVMTAISSRYVRVFLNLFIYSTPFYYP
jgi:hypothetical protein